MYKSKNNPDKDVPSFPYKVITKETTELIHHDISILNSINFLPDFFFNKLNDSVLAAVTFVRLHHDS